MKGELSPKATERFGRNDFENLSGICFANATVSLRLSHGAGLTAHRAVIHYRSLGCGFALPTPYTGEAFTRTNSACIINLTLSLTLTAEGAI